MSEITQWLQQASSGDKSGLNRVFDRLYPELRALANARLNSGQRTLNPTVLVHESYLRLLANDQLNLQDRRHFLACAACAMRAVVVDYVRGHSAQKRGGGEVPLTLSRGAQVANSTTVDWLELDQALDALEQIDSAQRELVELHFFAGLEFQEIAQLRGVDERTVRRHWQRARAFLHANMAS
jgi:RNA polymerase sigma factor (TIGR02999 family)